MEIASIQPVSNGKHLRLTVRKNGCSISAILFSATAEDFPYAIGDKVDLAVKLSENEYMGKIKVNVQIRDIKLSSFSDDIVISAEQDYEKFCLGEEIEENITDENLNYPV